MADAIEQQIMDTQSAPDTFTASDAYASRFSGKVGKFFLKKQEKSVSSLLPPLQGKQVLELGGAHGQLTPFLLQQGASVWVQASDEKSFQRLNDLKTQYPKQLQFFVSGYFNLPFEDNFFDHMISVRLISHVPEWEKLLKESARVTKESIIIDYPPASSFNVLYPLLFKIKKKIEGSTTRTFLRFSAKQMHDLFCSLGFSTIKEEKQFFFPMAFHRKMKCDVISSILENICASLGMTKLLGAPVILSAKRKEKI